jgi:N-acetylmuramoyl-L-alanine amidase
MSGIRISVWRLPKRLLWCALVSATASILLSSPHVEARLVQSPGATIQQPITPIHLKGTDYVPLIPLCERRGVYWNWDEVGQRLVLTKGSDKMVLALGLSNVLVNGSIRSLKKPVLMHDGQVLIPISIASDSWWMDAPIKPHQEHRFHTVIIDAGHGGKDPGALGQHGIKEKDVVLDIAKEVRDLLSRYGLNVIMTRDSDRFISLKGRTQIANQNGADFFVSIHANASRQRQASGFEVYYLSEAIDDDARAVASHENDAFKVDGEEPDIFRNADPTLWDLIHTENRQESIEMAESVIEHMRSELPRKNRGVKSARFYVLRGVETPSILIETGFVTNSKEAELLGTRFFRKRVARSISKGILAYKGKFEETNGFTE